MPAKPAPKPWGTQHRIAIIIFTIPLMFLSGQELLRRGFTSATPNAIPPTDQTRQTRNESASGELEKGQWK
ncbi:hypothetical protein BT69DRAFT_235037 [Atractiella rhizophila]|nr:hypothetical protein BT69DRAFT_235037 [Atractiella rhizophila]